MSAKLIAGIVTGTLVVVGAAIAYTFFTASEDGVSDVADDVVDSAKDVTDKGERVEPDVTE